MTAAWSTSTRPTRSASRPCPTAASASTGGRGSASPSASTCSTSAPPRPGCCPRTPGSSPTAPSTGCSPQAPPPGPRSGRPSRPGSPTRRTARAWNRCCPRRRRGACSCRSPSPTTSTSTPASTTPGTSARSSGRAASRSPRTGSTCRSATTAARARSSSPASPVPRPSGQRAHRRRRGRLRPLGAAGHRGRGGLRRRRGLAARRRRSGSTPFDRHVFGVCLVNDWSARDIQAWEYVPLGPFLGKSFATSVSPWIVPLAALDARPRRAAATRPAPLPYLDDTRRPAWGLDLAPGGAAQRPRGRPRPPFATMYWTPAQMLAHMTVNGASLRTGDLFASGTVSGPEPGQRGSLIELTWNGSRPDRAARRQRPRLPRGRRRGRHHRHRARPGRRPDRLRRGSRPGDGVATRPVRRPRRGGGDLGSELVEERAERPGPAQVEALAVVDAERAQVRHQRGRSTCSATVRIPSWCATPTTADTSARSTALSSACRTNSPAILTVVNGRYLR